MREGQSTIQANWRIDPRLKRWVDIEAAKRGLRPAHVIEECIRLMQDSTPEPHQPSQDDTQRLSYA